MARMPKLIGFMGAGGTGKTTTAKIVAENLSIPFVPSVVRDVAKRHGIVTEDDQDSMAPEDLLRFERDIFRATDVRDQEFEFGVCDRTPLDQLAYTLMRCSSVLDISTWHNIETQIRFMMSRYKMVFYFPLHTFPSHSDGMRTDIYGRRLQFDFLLQSLARQIGLTFYVSRILPPDLRAGNISNLARKELGFPPTDIPHT